MLEIQNLSAGYGKVEVLHGLTLSARPGQITVILGQNGCGKSTLLKAIAGTIAPTGGEIRLEGESLTQLSPGERAKKLACLAQGIPAPDSKLGQLVLHGRFPYLRYPRRYREEDYAAAAEAMSRMGILELADAPMQTLSGGTRQKAYIAMALAQEAPLILMDEPTAYLDIGQQVRFAKLARELAAEGKTLVLVLHDVLLALQLADTVYVMEDGVMAASGSPREIYRWGVLQRLYGVEIREAGPGGYYCPMAEK